MIKKIIILLVGLLLISTCIPLQAEIAQESRGKDWWSTEHHDVHNIGFSTSDAPDSNNVLWIQHTNDGMVSSPVVDHGRVFVGSEDSHLYCYHAETGTRIWNYSTESGIVNSPAVWQGKVYFSYEVDMSLSLMVCLDATTGKFLWNHPITGGIFNAITTAPTVADGYVIFGSINTNEYCLDAETGDLKWEFPAGDMIYSNAAIVDGNVYFGNYLGFLFCLEAETGNLLWAVDAREPNPEHNPDWSWPIDSAPCVYQDNVVFSRCDGTIFCLNTSLDGQEKWRTQAGYGGLTSPVVAYDRVYFGSYTYDDSGGERDDEFGKMYCLNLSDGQILYNYSYQDPTGKLVEGTFCSVADHKVYFTMSVFMGANYVYCLDSYHLKYLWRYQVGERTYTTPAIADSKLYLTSIDGNLYCFEDEDQQYPPNQPPNIPSNPIPQDNSNDVDIGTSAGWSCEDPDEEPLTFDVYFGQESSPVKVVSNQIDMVYDPGVLTLNTTYYWKIVAWDYHNASRESPVWSFTTQQEQEPPTVQITKPKSGYLYFNDKEIMKRIFSPTTLIIKSITIEVTASDAESGIRNVEFYIDGIKKANDSTAPYSWLWEEKVLFTHTIKVIAYDNAGNSASDETSQKKFL